MEGKILNEHNKQEYQPMHTAEHLVNGVIACRYGCGWAFSAHIERKKSESPAPAFRTASSASS